LLVEKRNISLYCRNTAVEWTAMSPDLSESLEEQVAALRARMQVLEDALCLQGVISPGFLRRPPVEGAPVRQDAAPAASTPVEPEQKTDASGAGAAPSLGVAAQAGPPPALPVAAPVFASYAAPAGTDTRSLENRIGSQWFNRVGILAVLIGMAWFLKFAIDNHWIGPLGRVLIGLAAGAGLIAWSEQFQKRGYGPFAYSLKAVGSGTLYLSLWAAFSLYHLMPASAAFGAMILVTAFNGFMAWIQDAELLALYAIVGGFTTPLLVSTGENHEVSLLSYMLLLDFAVLVLVVLRPWSRLLFAAFTGTVMIFGAWWFTYYSDTQAMQTALFLGGFFLIFALAPRLIRVDLEDGKLHSGWDALAMIVLPIANSALGFIAFYALLDPASGAWSGAWLAVGFAAFYLLLLQLPAMGWLQASPPSLAGLHLTAAVVFLTIAIPLKAQDRWLTIGWLVEGAALIWLASRTRLRLLRALAMICLALGLVALVTVNPDAATAPFLNARFGTYCVGISVFAFAAWIAARAKAQTEAGGTGTWPVIALGAVLTVNFLILLAVGWEIHSYWWALRWSGDSNQLQSYQMSAQFTYSAWFMVFGAILLGVGFWRRSAFLRWQALVLLAVTVGKVFLADMSQLSQGYRILSFLGLGALLLAVSFVYQRDWLKLRASKVGKNEA
jgi:uncharacterized membrane protein